MLLRTRSTFRRLWVGQFVSTIGDGMQRLVLLWWASQHGGSGLLLAMALCTTVPTVVASPVGGWLADHLDRRRLLVSADVVRLVTTSLLAVLVGTDDPPVVVVGLAVVLASVAAAVFDPTYSAAVPTVVAADDLPAANGLNMANSAVGSLVGPLAAGVLIGVTGPGWVLAVNAATFVWSAAVIATCRLPRPAAAEGHVPRAGVRRSIETVRSVAGLGRLVGLATTLNMVVAPVPVLLAALAVSRLDAGPVGFGLLQVLLGIGLLAGSLAAGVLARGRLALPFVVLGVALASIGVLPVVGVGCALLVAGGAVAIANTEAMVRFQRSVPPEVQGRVFGVLGSLSEGLRPLGLVLAAPLLGGVGVSGAFVVVGTLVVVASVLLTRGPSPSSRTGVASVGTPVVVGAEPDRT